MKVLEVGTFAEFEKLYDQLVPCGEVTQNGQMNDGPPSATALAMTDDAGAIMPANSQTGPPRNFIFLFLASDEPQTTESWCSDCRECKPIINKMIEDFKFNEQLALAKIYVGARDEWKRKDNPFREHKLKISAVPTLLNPKNGMKLVEAECADAAKVSHLFSNSI